MQKNISLISLDAALLAWLTENLNLAPDNLNGRMELLEALCALQCGELTTIMLENDSPWQSGSSTLITYDNLEINTKARRVRRDNKEIILTPKEFDILCFLASNRGEVFTKEQIYRAVWGDDYLLDDSNIMAFIRKIRRKIEPDPQNPHYLITVWGIGYKFAD